MKKLTGIFAAIFAIGFSLPVFAETLPPPFVLQEQQLKEKERLQEKESRESVSPIEIKTAPHEEEPEMVLPVGAFFVKKIEVHGTGEELDFLHEMAVPFENRKLSAKDIETILLKMNQKLKDKGYVTSEVVIPEQNISGGVMTLQCLPGRLGRVVYGKDSEHIPWENAFPIREGDLLNLRMLEEGLENMKRVPSLDVSMKILPSEKAGFSDLELTIHRRKQIHGLLSLDDSGMKETGRNQLSATISIDRLWNANDTLRISNTLDTERDWGDKGTRSQSISYSIPRGKDRLTFSYQKNRYSQKVFSIPYSFKSSGNYRTLRFQFEHMISRSQKERKSWDITISKRDSHYFINDTEIPVQGMDTAALEIGFNDRIYLGASTLYLRASHKQGMGWFGAQKENGYPGAPKTRYHMWLFDADWRIPFTMGHRPASFSTSFHGQWNTKGKRLYSVDMLSIGNRYTVRGFDGEYTLMGESGWYMRNELTSTLPSLYSEIYLGLDIGAVYGVSTDILTGRTISGMALGMRGDFNSGLSYDLFISRALYKPDGYHTKRWPMGFTVSWRF